MNNNLYSSMLSRPPQRSYTRQSGTASGLGQLQPQTCPSGYRFDQTQGKCVAVNMPKPGFWQQTAQGMTNPAGRTMPTQAKPRPPQFMPQAMPKSNQLSPYAQLMAQAIDLNPPLAQVQQPYYQQQPSVDPTPETPFTDEDKRRFLEQREIAAQRFLPQQQPSVYPTPIRSNPYYRGQPPYQPPDQNRWQPAYPRGSYPNIANQLNPNNDRLRMLLMGGR